MHKHFFKKLAVTGLCSVMLIELTGCGTVFYPERKGTQSGLIDPVVAAADAIGLLFFLIPGVIAFAVDFTNGTIYLPHGKHASLAPHELELIKKNGKINRHELNRLVSEKAGKAVNVDAPSVQVKRFNSVDALLAQMTSYELIVAGL